LDNSKPASVTRQVLARIASLLDSAAGLWQFTVMDADEREIYQFLKSWGNQFLAPREICRRAGGRKRFHDEPEWAKPVLLRMVERGILESNATGHYRIKPIRKKKEQDKRGVSPDIAKILKEGGVEVEAEATDEEDVIGPDEYYDEL
jgi:hypothetical protein